ncbi:MAG: hypothetical protein HYT20_03700 [Candidatus Nealsonbacteria bacterium]|nr:hypothetical protein [Candidatus Nealsonbacteria bacterium]
MQKIKNSSLLITSLALAGAIFFSVALAKAQDEKQLNGTEHRNAVSTFVNGLLNVAEKEKLGIGEEVKTVAQEQSDAKEKVAESIDKVQYRSKIKTLLIGTDYKNIGQLRSEMVKAGNRIDQLKKILEKAASEETKTALQGQVQMLEQEKQKIDDFLKANEAKFSIFGWFAKLFNK